MRSSGLIELDAVLAVARHRGFRAAADELGMSRSALSHAIAALESRLGVRLFNRTTRSVSLTEAGEQFAARVAPALSEIRGAMDEAGSRRATPAGTLRLNMSAGAARQMVPLFIDYARRYPEVVVDIVTEGRLVDIVLDGFDAGARLADQVPLDMVAIPVGAALGFAVVGSPDYFAGHPPPHSPTDLAQHRCIRSRLPSGNIYRWEFERHGEAITFDGKGPFILDEPTLMLQAARAGLGLAYVSEWNAREDLATGQLVRVLQDWTPSIPGLCLYYPSHRHVAASLRALVDIIRQMNRAI